MNIDKRTWIILGIISLLILYSSVTKKTGETDKPPIEAYVGSGGLGASVTGLIIKKMNPAWVALGVLGFIFMLPQWFAGWKNLFSPAPTIPSWVWIAGFFLLFIMFMRRK